MTGCLEQEQLEHWYWLELGGFQLPLSSLGFSGAQQLKKGHSEDLLVGGIAAEPEQGVVAAGGPSGTVGLVCSGCSEYRWMGHNFDVGWVVCGENGLHGEAEARLVDSVYFVQGEAG